MPRSVQQSIPIDRIYADGVWQSENVFSLMWQISDINYAMQSDAAKQNILTQLGTVYAGIPADCWMQVCIVSQRMDEKAFARDVLYHRENDGFDALRAERNRQIKANARENGNVVQHKYIIVSTNKPGVKEARERFVQVQGHLLSAFSALECSVTPLDNRARLEVLHKFFRISEEGRFNFDFDNCAKLGQDFRDSIAPDCIRFCKKHIEIEDFYAKCMTISEYPQQLDDKFISALLQQVPYIVLSIDIEPVETEDAFKEIDSAQMKTDAEKVRFNKKSVENLDFTSSVPQRTQEQDRIIANIRKEMTENDQQMFLSLLTVTYFADTLEDLALETDALKTTAANYNCRFTELYFQQERAFNTAMPYGLRRIESVRTMLTKSLTALVPFNTQEILTPGGICYGRNAVTGNLIIGLRTTLVNGNAMVVATSGGGKSMFVKLEILMLYLRFTKARFYIVDPENEYAPLVQELGGEVVNISVDSSTYFNPLDFKPDKSTDIPPYVAKAEFVLSLCEQIMKKENVLPGDRSLIDRALRSIYKPLIESKYTAPCPTIKDLWAALNSQGDNRSKELALALEIFATGSMQVFAQPTNVDMSNRLICFNIQSLGEQLKPVAMLSINNKQATVEAISRGVHYIAAKIKALLSQTVRRAAQSLLALLGAGGVVLVLAMVIGTAAAVIGSPMGILFADESGDPNSIPIAEIVADTNADFGAAINDIVSAHPECSETTITYDYEDGHTWASYWPEVLAIFAVHTNLNSDSDVVVINAAQMQRIQDTFWAMHEITYEVEEVDTTPEPSEDDPDPEQQTDYILHITVSSKTVDELAELYNFTQDQNDILHELLSDEMRPTLLALCGGIGIIEDSAAAGGLLCCHHPY